MTLKTDSNSNPSWTAVNNQSFWMATSEVTPKDPLNQDETADVCVVGAGIAGMTTAYLLAREGKNVVVLDDGPIGGVKPDAQPRI